MPPPPLLPQPTAEEVSQQCFSSMKGALACLSISIGHKLGLFQQLAAQGPCSTAALAAAAGVTERWVREWCHQLAAARFISCDAQAAQFWLSEGQRAVLVEAGPGEQARATPLGGFDTAHPACPDLCLYSGNLHPVLSMFVMSTLLCCRDGVHAAYSAGQVGAACGVLPKWQRAHL